MRVGSELKHINHSRTRTPRNKNSRLRISASSTAGSAGGSEMARIFPAIAGKCSCNHQRGGGHWQTCLVVLIRVLREWLHHIAKCDSASGPCSDALPRRTSPCFSVSTGTTVETTGRTESSLTKSFKHQKTWETRVAVIRHGSEKNGCENFRTEKKTFSLILGVHLSGKIHQIKIIQCKKKK